MALATAAFSGREALAIAVAGPLVQFPVMLCYLEILGRFPEWSKKIVGKRF
jgi:ACR3 family arsenite efflux pump ArsB